MVQKEPQLLMNVEENLYVIYRIMWSPMTLNDRYGTYQFLQISGRVF